MSVGPPTPPVSQLEAGALALALAWARDTRATGCFVIRSGGAVNRLYLEEGRPTSAVLAQGYLPLAQLLVEQKFLDEAALDQALEEVYGGLPLEEAVVKTGVMTEARLVEALETQEQLHLRLLGELPTGELEFTTEAPSTPTRVRLSAERSLLEVLECPPSAPVVQARLDSLGTLAARLTSAFDASLSALRLTEAERTTAELLRAGLSSADFAAQTSALGNRARALLALLLELQLAEAVDLAAEAESRRAQAAREQAEAAFALAQRERSILAMELAAVLELGAPLLQAHEADGLARELQLRAAAEARERWWQAARAVESLRVPEPSSREWLLEDDTTRARFAQASEDELARVAFTEARDVGRERERRREVLRWKTSIAVAEARLEAEQSAIAVAREELRARELEQDQWHERSFEEAARIERVDAESIALELRRRFDRAAREEEARQRAEAEERERIEEASRRAETDALIWRARLFVQRDARREQETRLLEALYQDRQSLRAELDWTSSLELRSETLSNVVVEVEARARSVEAERSELRDRELARLEAERREREEARAAAERRAEAARQEAERRAQEAERREAERRAADFLRVQEENQLAEAVRLEAERQDAVEQARLEAERVAAAEAARLEAERVAAAEAARLEAERVAAAEAEAARLEAERAAAAEAARLEAERIVAAEAAEVARAEAERITAAEAAEVARAEAERIAAAEAARLEAERAAAAEAARLEAERVAAAEAARLEAERAAAARLEAERAATVEAARLEAERAAAARLEAERAAAVEAARIEAERAAAAEAARLEAERVAAAEAAEAARIEAERVAAAEAAEAARIEAERAAAVEAARLEAERATAAEAAEAARIEAERVAAAEAAEAARIEAERLAAAEAAEAARLEAESVAAAEAARLEAERVAAAEAARLDAERVAAAGVERVDSAEAARLEAQRVATANADAALLQAAVLPRHEEPTLDGESSAPGAAALTGDDGPSSAEIEQALEETPRVDEALTSAAASLSWDIPGATITADAPVSQTRPGRGSTEPDRALPRPSSAEKVTAEQPVFEISDLEIAAVEPTPEGDTAAEVEKALERARAIKRSGYTPIPLADPPIASARSSTPVPSPAPVPSPTPVAGPPPLPTRAPSRTGMRAAFDSERDSMLRARLSAQRHFDRSRTEAYERARREDARATAQANPGLGNVAARPSNAPAKGGSAAAAHAWKNALAAKRAAAGVPAPAEVPDIAARLRPPPAARVLSESDAAVQAEIQRKFDEQARAWLAEEGGSGSGDDGSPLDSLAGSFNAHVTDSMTSDLESLLARSLVRPDSASLRAAAPGGDELEYHFESISHAAGDDADTREVESLWDEGDPMATDEDRARKARLRLRGLQNLGAIHMPGDPPPNSAPAPAPAAARPPTPAAPLAPVAARPPSKPSPAAGGPRSIDDTRLSEEIKARFAVIKSEDYFQRLGLTRAAAPDQVKAAYFNLVKRFHPDKVPASLASQTAQVEHIFGAIREAYDCLSRQKERLEYLATLRTQPAPGSPGTGSSPAANKDVAKGKREVAPEAALEARKLRVLGEMAFRKKAFPDAESAYAKAYAIENAPNDLAAQAWAIYLDPNRKDDLLKVKDLLRSALAADAGADRAHYVSGVLARANNDLAAAEKHFQAALRANPQNTDAALEMRVINRRKDKEGGTPPSGTKKKGLFGL